MKTQIEVELKPFAVPNFALVKPATENADETSLPLSALSPETLECLCLDFTAAVFRKAGKLPPPTSG